MDPPSIYIPANRKKVDAIITRPVVRKNKSVAQITSHLDAMSVVNQAVENAVLLY